MTTYSLMSMRGVDTYYGRVQILRGLDLDVPKDAITAVIGPNGAGKSTALKAMFGLVPVAQGRVQYRGTDVTNRPPQAMVRDGVCFVPQGRAVFPSLTVTENLAMGAYVVDDPDIVARRTDEVFDRFARLRERARQTAGSLSGGEQQMLAMGRALMVDPELLLLDEPSVGLAPRVVDEILESILLIRREGKTIVMVEQNAVMALEIANHAFLLVRGRTEMSGQGRELLGDPEVQRVYLGGGSD